MEKIIKKASAKAGSSLVKYGVKTVEQSVSQGIKLMLVPVPIAGMMATGMAISATHNTSKSIMSLLAKHPVITFSLGLAAGYIIHKYRKAIIEAATGVTEKGKEFVLQQKENLADVLSETREAGEA